MTILDQGILGKCVNSAWLGSMERMGIVRNPQLMLNATPGNFISDKRACEYFNSLGFKITTKPVFMIQLKGILSRNIPIIAGFNGYKMESIRNAPFIAEFDDDHVHSHRFIIINECEVEDKLLYNKEKRKELGLLLAQNSWSDKECDNGYFYIKIEDISRFGIMFKKGKLISPITIYNQPSNHIIICNQSTENISK